jgi:hypothetical protein
MNTSSGTPHVLSRDEKTKHWPILEPFALKTIRKWVKAQGHSPSFLRKLNSFYLTLAQIVTMNGQGAIIRTAMLEEFSGVHHGDFARIKNALTTMELARFKELRLPGSGNRKTVYCDILSAPYQGKDADVSFRFRPRDSAEQALADVDDEPNVNTCHLKAIKEDPSVITTNVVIPSGYDRDENGEPEKHYEKRYGPLSLRDWTRIMVADHHALSPTRPPDGSSYVQAVSCAISTIAGFHEFIDNAGGFSTFTTILHRFMKDGMGNYAFSYQSWMDAALSLESVPSPTGTSTTLAYFLAVIRNKASEAASARYEIEHQKSRDEWNRAGDVTVEDILRTAQEMGISLGVGDCTHTPHSAPRTLVS